MEWTHQLVFQFDASTTGDFDRLSAVELAIKTGLPKGAEVDGHDFGLGEFNIFILTNDPVAMFEPVCEMIDQAIPGVAFSAGYRNFNEEEYTVLWPPSSTKFSVA
jgi:hypothetical protein